MRFLPRMRRHAGMLRAGCSQIPLRQLRKIRSLRRRELLLMAASTDSRPSCHKEIPHVRHQNASARRRDPHPSPQHFNGNVLTLPEQLPRETYLRVAKVLTPRAANGTEGQRPRLSFDPRELIGAVVEDGVVVDARKPLASSRRLTRWRSAVIGLSGIAPGETVLEPSAASAGSPSNCSPGASTSSRSRWIHERRGTPPSMPRRLTRGRRRPHSTLRAIRGISGPRGRAVRRGHLNRRSQQSRHEAHSGAWEFVRPGRRLIASAQRVRSSAGHAAREFARGWKRSARTRCRCPTIPSARAAPTLPPGSSSPPSRKPRHRPLTPPAIGGDPRPSRWIRSNATLTSRARFSSRSRSANSPPRSGRTACYSHRRPALDHGRTPYVVAVASGAGALTQINKGPHHPGNRGRTEKHHDLRVMQIIEDSAGCSPAESRADRSGCRWTS